MKDILKKAIFCKNINEFENYLKQRKDFYRIYLASNKSIKHFTYELSSIIQKNSFSEFITCLKKLSTDIQFLKGIGPKRALMLKQKGIKTFNDFLLFLPTNYLDFTKIVKIKSAKVNQEVNLILRFKELNEIKFSKRKIAQAIFYDDSGEIIVKWFNYNLRYLKKFLIPEKEYFISGRVSFFNFYKEIIHPFIEEANKVVKGILPVYSEIKNFPQKSIITSIRNLINLFKNKNFEYIPVKILIEENLPSIMETLSNLHFPNNNCLEDIKNFSSKYHKRLIFDEFFFLMLAIGKEKKRKEILTTKPYVYKGEIVKKFIDSLSFELTNAQKKVLREIYNDFKSGKVMNRLIQGDVGSGKTIVAFISSLIAIENNKQVAFMVPTEILAEQHFINFKKVSKNISINFALLTGSTPKKEKQLILRDLELGNIDFIIGTHALIEENIKFRDLGYIIIDEQHKFGVRQRMQLKQKGDNVHTLIMTATPIPRTLTLTIYGDLDVSIIDELPPGRKQVKTFWFYEKEYNKYLPLIKKELKKGRQAYFVYPLIEESDKLELKDVIKMKDKLSKEFFPEFKVEMLHGKMKSYEKDKIMKSFKDGKIDILASTTVIEVGVDIPNATIMVIENAERFGLAQLHQLRGRVGRGNYQSYCILISSNKLSDIAKKRLKVMCNTTDGFKIAEEDLKIRGPGEFLGTKQSGLPEFKFGDIVRDYKILIKAKKYAFEIIDFDFSLEKFPALKKMFDELFLQKLPFINTG